MKKEKELFKKISKIAVTVSLGLLVFLGGGTGSGRVGKALQSYSQPNIVVIMTDDQDLSSLWVMPNVQKLASQGMVFANNYVSYSLCCPSRATFLTGQYAHNTGVLSNNGETGGGYVNLNHTQTLPIWLQNAGYYTGYIGKYLNGYGVDDSPTVAGGPPYEIPPGWSEWYGTIDPSTYYYFDYSVNENGIIKSYGNSAEDYNTDVFSGKAVSFIQRAAGTATPFFLSVNFLAPHAELSKTMGSWEAPRPAPRHAGIYQNEPLPRSPSFNEEDVSDKPLLIQQQPLLSAEKIANITYFYRRRLESLLAVDEAVGQMVSTLSGLGLLGNTLFIFTSDNGFLLGEHRLDLMKVFLYEESTRVPLMVSGVGVKLGEVGELAVNIDLAPTIVELAKASAGLTMDGRSLVPFLTGSGSTSWRSDFLLESFVLGKSYGAVRNQGWVYAEHDSSARELYDLYNDPYQLVSLHGSAKYQPLIKQFQKRLAVLKSCQGQGCW